MEQLIMQIWSDKSSPSNVKCVFFGSNYTPIDMQAIICIIVCGIQKQ